MEKQYLEELSETLTKVMRENKELSPILESFEQSCEDARADHDIHEELDRR